MIVDISIAWMVPTPENCVARQGTLWCGLEPSAENAILSAHHPHIWASCMAQDEYDPKFDPKFDPRYDPRHDREHDPRYNPGRERIRDARRSRALRHAT